MVYTIFLIFFSWTKKIERKGKVKSQSIAGAQWKWHSIAYWSIPFRMKKKPKGEEKVGTHLQHNDE